MMKGAWTLSASAFQVVNRLHLWGMLGPEVTGFPLKNLCSTVNYMLVRLIFPLMIY